MERHNALQVMGAGGIHRPTESFIMRTFFAVISIFAVSVVVACEGADETSTPEPAGKGSADLKAVAVDYCQARHDNTAACSQDDVSKQLANCQTNAVPCYASTFRADYMTALRDGAKAQKCAARDGGRGCSCTPGEDELFRAAAQGLTATAKGSAFQAACAAKVSACGSERSFEHWCDSGATLVDDAYIALQKCLDLACENNAIGLCMKQAMLELSAGSCDKNKM